MSRRSTARESGRQWLAPTLLFVLLFAIYAPTISHHSLSFDVFGANWTSWHLVAHGTPWIDGTRIPALEHGGPKSVLIVTGQNGHTAWGRFPGVVVVSLPAYLLAHAVGVTGMTPMPGGLTAAALTAAAVTLMFLALRDRLDARTTWLASLAFALTTPVWSVSANGLWPHTITVFGIAGMAWAATRERWYLFGLFGGVALWGRLHVALVVAVAGLILGARRRDARLVLRVALTCGLSLVGFCLWVHWMYGGWSPFGAYGSGEAVAGNASAYRFSLVNQLGMWVAPDRGILVWTPVAALLLPALVRSWRELPDWSRSLLWGGLAYTVVNSMIATFTGGDSFYGYRYGLEFLACATPALAFSAARMGAVARALVGPLLSLQLLAVAYGAVSDTYLGQQHAWHENAFVHGVAPAGAAAWTIVALFVCLGALGGRWWQRGASAPGQLRSDEASRVTVPA